MSAPPTTEGAGLRTCLVKGIKMKKKAVTLLLASMCLGMLATGCGTSASTKDTKTTVATEASAETETEVETEQPDEVEATEIVIETETEAVDESTETADTKSAETATIGGSYVDFDNMQFAINGKTYTLGQTTLQELIDDGVPFNEDDIANASNNLNKNSQSSGFRITLGDYWSGQVYVFNDSDAGKTASECYISEVYLPMHIGETQNVMSFAFPVDMTLDELLANESDPTDNRTYEGESHTTDTVEYKKDSTKYYGQYGYKFEFLDGNLQYITIDYLP